MQKGTKSEISQKLKRVEKKYPKQMFFNINFM